jgi:hypothetical protein
VRVRSSLSYEYRGGTPCDGWVSLTLLPGILVVNNTAGPEILGIPVVVVLDRVFLAGVLKEKTFDWYAQDEDGNVWYFGEDTKEFENGKVVSTAGSFEAGKNGAKASAT